MRRQSRAAEARPKGFGQRLTGEEQVFYSNRGEAQLFIRSLVARARSTAVFVDPYFDRIDLREFALAAQYPDAAVHVLTGREHLWQEDGDLLAGDAFAADLQALPAELSRFRYPVPDVRLMSEDRGWHDRFLVVDDEVWHFGHSFNRKGRSEVSMAIRLRYPGDVRAWILEDVARGSPYIEGWADIKRQWLDEMIAAAVAAWKVRDPGERA
jgi:hypothetical protein